MIEYDETFLRPRETDSDSFTREPTNMDIRISSPTLDDTQSLFRFFSYQWTDRELSREAFCELGEERHRSLEVFCSMFFYISSDRPEPPTSMEHTIGRHQFFSENLCKYIEHSLILLR